MPFRGRATFRASSQSDARRRTSFGIDQRSIPEIVRATGSAHGRQRTASAILREPTPSVACQLHQGGSRYGRPSSRRGAHRRQRTASAISREPTPSVACQPPRREILGRKTLRRLRKGSAPRNRRNFMLFSYSVSVGMPRRSKTSGHMRTACPTSNSGLYSRPAMPYFAPAVL